jgi:hypothetical protein
MPRQTLSKVGDRGTRSPALARQVPYPIDRLWNRETVLPIARQIVTSSFVIWNSFVRHSRFAACKQNRGLATQLMLTRVRHSFHARTGTLAVRSSLPQLTQAPLMARRIAFQTQ